MENVYVICPGPGSCQIWGDPHYLTFDGQKYEFQGDCDYTLVTQCAPQTDLPTFHLWGDNVKVQPSRDLSILRRLSLEYAGNVFSLGPRSQIRVNDVRFRPPVNQNGVTINYRHRSMVRLSSDLYQYF